MVKQKIVTLPNNTKAIDLLPAHQGLAAVVSLSVLQKIVLQLPRRNFEEIKENFLDDLHDTSCMEDYLRYIQDELAFHQAVNNISTIDLGEISQEVKDSVVA